MQLLKTTRLDLKQSTEITRIFHPDKRQKPDRTILAGGRKLRHELKYLIDEGTYLYLRSRLLPLMNPDPHGENGEYRVTSIYFDDVYNSGYWQKINGMETRRKFRVRAYDLDPGLIHLEAKHKDESYVSKLTAGLTQEQYLSLLNGNCAFMSGSDGEEDAFGEYYRSALISRLRPRVIVDYQREALIYPFGNVRVTFDKKLSACYNTMDMFAQEAQYTRIYDKEIILEVKFDNYLPDSIYSALQCFNAPQQPVSKYMLCADKMVEEKFYG